MSGGTDDAHKGWGLRSVSGITGNWTTVCLNSRKRIAEEVTR